MTSIEPSIHAVGSAQEKLDAVRVAKTVKGVKSVDASGVTVNASAGH